MWKELWPSLNQTPFTKLRRLKTSSSNRASLSCRLVQMSVCELYDVMYRVRKGSSVLLRFIIRCSYINSYGVSPAVYRLWLVRRRGWFITDRISACWRICNKKLAVQKCKRYFWGNGETVSPVYRLPTRERWQCPDHHISWSEIFIKKMYWMMKTFVKLLNQYFYPAAEAEAAAKSRAMQWLLRRPVWKALLSQFDCLHELWSHPRRDSGPGQRRRPLEVHHRASQQRQGQRNSSRVVSLSGYNVMIQSFVVCSMYGTCVHTKKMYYNNGHFDWITA